MLQETTGTVIAVYRQWWLKINKKPIRIHALDGAVFPHIIKIRYEVDGKEYLKLKWIKAGHDVPSVGDSLKILYRQNSPAKSTVL